MRHAAFAVIFIILFSALTLAAFLGIRRAKELSSDTLLTRTTEIQGNNGRNRVVRVDYVNDDGAVIQPSDKCYATVVRTYDGKRVILEEYFDAEGAPAVFSSGYSAVSRNYNDSGQSVIITYLNAYGEPVVTGSGYSSIHRTINEEGRADTDTYYISDEQVMRKGGYYGYQRLYTDGKATTLRYLDQSGELMMRDGGYAMIRREFDADGNVVRRMYYDASGAPVTIGRFQYGIEMVEGRAVYLDENGEQMLRLDNFLFSHPYFVLGAGLVLTALALVLALGGRTGLQAAFIVCYLLFICFMTLMYRETGDMRSRLEPLWSYRRFFTSSSLRRSIVNNICIFVPFGAALYRPGNSRCNRMLLLMPAILSCMIEAIQYFAGIGMCEVDDVISNSLGGWLGFALAVCADELLGYYKCLINKRDEIHH